MKILHVITSLRLGGAEKLMVDLLPRFKQDGFDVALLLLDGTDTPFKRKLKESGIQIFELGYGSVYNLLHIVRIIPYLKKYDIVHTHNFTPQLFAAIGSLLCSVNLVSTEHTTANRRRAWPWYRPIDRWMYNRYKKIICISDKTEEKLKEAIRNLKPDIETIYNGIDTKAFYAAKSSPKLLSAHADQINLMMVAGFRHQKDQPTVIQAMAILPEKFHVFFVGDGICRQKCEIMAQQLGVKDRVHFLGHRTDIPALLQSSDAVIMSSIWEGFGLAAVEGMAAHKPVVASNVSGLREVVAGAGLLFEKSDSQDLATKIEQLFADEVFFKETADICLARAREYDISNMVGGYEAVYMQLMKENDRSEN